MTKIFLLLLVTLSPMTYADELKKIQICMDKMKELCVQTMIKNASIKNGDN